MSTLQITFLCSLGALGYSPLMRSCYIDPKFRFRSLHEINCTIFIYDVKGFTHIASRMTSVPTFWVFPIQHITYCAATYTCAKGMFLLITTQEVARLLAIQLAKLLCKCLNMPATHNTNFKKMFQICNPTPRFCQSPQPL